MCRGGLPAEGFREGPGGELTGQRRRPGQLNASLVCIFFFFNLIFDEVYVVDKGWNDQESGESGRDRCLHVFFFFFLFLGMEGRQGEKLLQPPSCPSARGRGTAPKVIQGPRGAAFSEGSGQAVPIVLKCC